MPRHLMIWCFFFSGRSPILLPLCVCYVPWNGFLDFGKLVRSVPGCRILYKYMVVRLLWLWLTHLYTTLSIS